MTVFIEGEIKPVVSCRCAIVGRLFERNFPRASFRAGRSAHGDLQIAGRIVEFHRVELYVRQHRVQISVKSRFLEQFLFLVLSREIRLYSIDCFSSHAILHGNYDFVISESGVVDCEMSFILVGKNASRTSRDDMSEKSPRHTGRGRVSHFEDWRMMHSNLCFFGGVCSQELFS